MITRSRSTHAPFCDDSLLAAVALYRRNERAAEEKYGPIGEWDVSCVTNTENLFHSYATFHADLSRWNVSSVTDMDAMFAGCATFHADLSKWDVSKVKTMVSMFYNCAAFDADLSGWDVGNIECMSSMFAGCAAFRGRVSDSMAAKMRALGVCRPGRWLWRVARRLVHPIVQTRCIGYFWLELAAHPLANGQAPRGAIESFVADF